MYFPALENLKTSIPIDYIKSLDYWLGSMASIYRKKINPRDFAIRNGMDIESVLGLFDLAVEKSILQPKIIVVNDEKVPFDTFYNISDVPETMEDYERNTIFKVESHNMEIWYELIAYPKVRDASDEKKSNIEEATNDIERSTLDVLEKSGASETMNKLGMRLKNWKK